MDGIDFTSHQQTGSGRQTSDFGKKRDLVILPRRELDQGLAELDDQVVVTAGVPFGTPGKTNVLRIATVRVHTRLSGSYGLMRSRWGPGPSDPAHK